MLPNEVFHQIDSYVLRLMAESTPAHTAWNIEKIRHGAPSDWNYIDGCMMTALLALSDITGDDQYFSFVDGYIGDFISEDGVIRTFREDKRALDDINEGRVLFSLYERTGNASAC